ncbi:MAG: hypothetical protein NT075_23585 [Chloroflexi bacterium]|nr:hypothetical protein [Chloroflexota bacterium]
MDNQTMTFEEAIEIKVNGTDDSDLNYEATKVIESAVLAISKYGDPEELLQDWISESHFELIDTPESITKEWDSGRE